MGDASANLDVAFLMDREAQGITRNEFYECDLAGATVDVYGDGGEYRLVKMGALMTNRSSIGSNRNAFTRDNLDGSRRMVDIPAVYLYRVSKTGATFAVRVINVPSHFANVVIYARPYYVFEKDGEEAVVYGDIYSRSYNNSGEDILWD